MFQHAGIELACRDHAVAVAQEQVNEDTVTRCERAAEGSVVDLAHAARRTAILQDARSDLGRAARLLAYIERTLSA